MEYKSLVAIVKRETRKLKSNAGKHLYRELNMIYMDARQMHVKLLKI